VAVNGDRVVAAACRWLPLAWLAMTLASCYFECKTGGYR